MQAGFISGGETNFREGLEERIRQEVLAEYAEALSQAGPVRRIWLRLRIGRMIRRRVASEFSHYDSPYNLYGSSHGATGDRAKKTSDEPPRQSDDPA
jgi:hypothetical protein